MTRDEIEALLPFLANDTLEGEERAALEAALAADPDLQGELDALRAIRAAMQAEEVRSPGEFGHARLMRALDAEATSEASDPLAARAPSAPPRGTGSRPVIWQIAAALLLAVVVGQIAFSPTPPDAPGFELAGVEPAFVIAIAETATEAEIRAVLLQAGVEIVAGPSALGFYELRALDGVSEVAARAVLAASSIVELQTSEE